MRLTIILFLLFYGLLARAAGPAAYFERLSIDDGLSQNTIFNIVQDRKGFMWIATMDGLNRYDGYEFKVYRHDPQDPNSLSENSLSSLYLDATGTLWIGTRGGGLNRFDATADRFEPFRHDAKNPHSLSNDIVWAIHEDPKGTLWVGTEGGLNRFDRQTQRFEHFTHDDTDAHSLSDNNVQSVYTDKKGHLWVGTLTGGLNRLDAKSKNFSHYRHEPTNPHSLGAGNVRAIYEDSGDTLWFGTPDGLSRFDPQTNQFFHFRHDKTDPNSLSHNFVVAIKENIKGQLWIATLGGLNLFNTKNEQFVRFKHQPTDPHSLSRDSVFTIYEDNKQVLWVGTYGGGLNKYDPLRARFGHFKHQASDPHSLNNNNIRAIYKADQGPLWLGTDGGGLNRYNAESQRFEHFEHQPSVPDSLSSNRVWSIAQDDQQQLWIATWRGGLNKYHAQQHTFEHFRHRPADPNSLSSDTLTLIRKGAKGGLWLGTWDDGLNRLDPITKRVERFSHDAANPYSLSHDNISMTYEDRKGRLWIGTYVGGLNRFDAASGRFKHFKHRPSDPSSLSHNNVVAAFEDDNGLLWFGTKGGGLNKFDPKTAMFTHYRERDGLANDSVYSIFKDQQGFFWLSTNKGISRFNPVTEQFKNYDASDGLQSNEFHQGAAFQSADGELFFGGINGFNRFYPQNITDDQQTPPVVLTRFLLDNKPVPVHSQNSDQKHKQNSGQNSGQKNAFGLNKTIDEVQQLTLNHRQNLMSFEFAALNFRSPMKNRYAYQLQGWDQDWIVTDAKNRRATYTNIPPGDYTLRVKASNQDGYWNEQGASLKITLLPPPWKTWWAYLIYVLLLMSLILLVVYVLTEHRKHLNERKLNAQLKQVDKIKDEFLANTSHELRTPLNGIIGLTESLMDGIAGQLPAQANNQLAMVISSGKRLANLVNDILDFAKLENHSLALHRQPVDLHNIIEVVLALSQHLVGDKPLTLSSEVAVDLPAVYADEERLQQILYNLLGNAIKFTEQGNVTVSAEMQGDSLKVSVTDSGIGIAADKFDDIFKSFEQVQGSDTRRYGGTGLGLAVSKELIALHGGQIAVASAPGQGSVFSFTLPLSEEKPLANSKVNQALTRLHTLQDHIEHVEYEEQPDPLPTDVDENDGSGFRLLLVDDEPINRLVLRNHLSQQNYRLVEAVDGEAALLAIEQDGPFDLVLLDIMMPKISGYEVCERLREQYSVNELPVIFLTAKNQEVDVVQSFAVGANDYLSKPVAKHELLARVETHLKLLDINRHLEGKVAERTNELEQKNREILATQQQMIESETMASLGTLTAGVAHEINNPTSFLYVSVQNLEEDLTRCRQFIFDLAGDDAEVDIINGLGQQFSPLYQHLETIKNGAERIKVIVQDLRAFSRLKAGEKKTVEVDRLLQSTINLIKTKYFEVTTFSTELEPQLELDCYPAQLNQVIMNLVVNACDAIREYKQAQESRILGKITIGCRRLDDMIEISIQDDGNGMTDETKNKLFDPFYTTKGPEEGTGLGLSISLGIVHEHGGELEVESELGVGSKFRILLPC